MSATLRVAAAQGECVPGGLQADEVAHAQQRDPVARDRLVTLGTRERLSVAAR